MSKQCHFENRFLLGKVFIMKNFKYYSSDKIHDLREMLEKSAKLYATRPAFYEKKNGEYVEMKVVSSSVQKTMVISTLEGVETLEDAIALRGTVFYAAREDFRLRRGEYFIADLLDLPVFDDDTGEEIGRLINVLTPGAHQVYVIDDGDGSFMLPNVPEFVRRISFDDDAGIYVHLIEGMRENSR